MGRPRSCLNSSRRHNVLDLPKASWTLLTVLREQRKPTDRIKDCIRRRGENISSYEVEQILNEHPDVAETAVIGVRVDGAGGAEEVMACVGRPRRSLTGASNACPATRCRGISSSFTNSIKPPPASCASKT
ncbi:hypothetical protein C2W62_37265 [Candidatus Entotheonella serta]|nr:hypothetical protein C2W62_37265 [Candidatus Entotheonella serta]